MSTPAKVLVVDDTPANVKLLADLLGVKGYAVSTAVNGEQALAIVDGIVHLPLVMPPVVTGYLARQAGGASARGGRRR